MKERLVNVDKLRNEINQFGYYITYKDVLDELKNAPIVPAITLDKLKELKDTYGTNCRLGHVIKIVERMYGLADEGENPQDLL